MIRKIFLISFCALFFSTSPFAQNLNFERERHKAMLDLIKGDVKKNYFDPTFKGIDLDANYKAAAAKLETAASIGQMSGIIAQFLIDFDDSHLFFLPPGKANKTDYGFDFRMVGDRCFVYQIDKGSDAEKKGLQVGDEIYSVERFGPTRENLWKLQYYFFSLRPQAGLNLIVVKPDGKQAQYAIEAKIKTGKRVMDLTAGQDINQVIRESEDADRKETKQYFYDKLAGVFIWKVPGFSLDPARVDEIMGRARKFPAMILDLRGNGGGRVDMTMRLIGNVFTEDLKVADEKRRKATKEIIAKTRGKDAFAGKIVVLIDSGSASASEIFSRVVQLEKRGQIIGDRSAGAVMESKYFGQQLGLDTVIFFGASITIADMIMKDGKSLEKTGVTPDVLILPTGKDLATRRDVVLSKAAESLGVNLTPEVAGAIFPEDTGEN